MKDAIGGHLSQRREMRNVRTILVEKSEGKKPFRIYNENTIIQFQGQSVRMEWIKFRIEFNDEIL